MSNIFVVGSGFAGLSAAATLAKKGHQVTILEKNAQPGGRARHFEVEGFTFDMGPSWYWMPGVFEEFYAEFGYKTEDFYELVRLDPSYRVYFGKDDYIDLPADYDSLRTLFESMEVGAADKLDQFLASAEYKYNVGMSEFVKKPSLSIFEFVDFRLLRDAIKLNLFTSLSSEVRRLFKNERIRKILEFPVLFLGAPADKIPSLYSLMNYADLKLGTWYPMGGMYKVIEAFTKICEDQGVKFLFNQEVIKTELKDNTISKLVTTQGEYDVDYLINTADYHHFETEVVPSTRKSYTDSYWDKITMAPSSLLFYLGLNHKIENLSHHTLFFDKELDLHSHEIYNEPKWPSEPLFYICSPSITDDSVAPDDCENVFILMPLAPGIEDTEELREQYFQIILSRLKELTGQDIGQSILFKKSYCVKDFKSDYNAFKGNAYGLANTLQQTAFLKPKMRSKKINNLFYAGQLTTPGPGVPPSIISGQVSANLLHNYMKGI